jgi:predicted enzyme related to lactoylglutathione lyase
VEINSPDLARSAAFFEQVFGWAPEPFAAPDYLVAAAGDGPGIDTGLLASRDGQPRAVPVIRVDDLQTTTASVVANGGAVAVPAFSISGVGQACHVVDPAGVLIGLHQYDPTPP